MYLVGFHFCMDEARAIAAFLAGAPVLAYLVLRFRCAWDWLRCRLRGHRHATHEHEHHHHDE